MRKSTICFAVLGLMPAASCFGQYYFTPISATFNTQTWYSQNVNTDYADATGYKSKTTPNTINPGEDASTPDTGNAQESVGAGSGAPTSTTAYSLVSDPLGTSSLVPSHNPGGIVMISLSASTNSNSPDFINADSSVIYSFYVYGPEPSMNVNLSITGDQNAAMWSLSGPGNTTWPDGSYTDLPQGVYTLNCLATTEYVNGIGGDGSVSGTVLVVPEPANSIAALGILALGLRARRA